MIDNPQPIWLVLLLLAFPGVVLSACAVNSTIFPPEGRPLSTIPAIVLVLALLPTHFLALAFGSLNIGVVTAWTIIGLAGYAWSGYHWQNFRFTLGSERTRKLAIALISSCLIVAPTILLNFHDEDGFNEHHAIIANLQNGTYPPRYLYDPILPLRYHYGFDLAASIVTGVLRVRLDHAIDIMTLVLWPCMFLLLWRIGNHFGGKRAGLFVTVAICSASGWPALCTSEFADSIPLWYKVASQLAGFCKVGNLAINPPFISYFFQHPWSIGIPIFCLVILQRAAIPRLGDPRLSVAMMVCSLSLLSLCEVVLFISTVVALGICEAWRLSRDHAHASVWMLLAVGLSLLGAKLAGGFFTFWPASQAGTFFAGNFGLHEYSGVRAVVMQAQWDAATFGALLILGIIGMLQAERDRMFLVALAVFPFFILHVIQYRYTWDIVKFATVTTISLAIGTGITLSRLWDSASGRVRTGAFALVALLAGLGVLYPILIVPLRHRDPNFRMIRPYLSREYPIDQDNANAISYLRTHMGPEDIVFRSDEKSQSYATWGGLPTQNSVHPAQTEDNDQYGLGPTKFLARKDLSRVSPSWLDRLSAERIGWLVTDPEDTAVNKLLETPASVGRAILRAQYGHVRVYRIH
jgi:hypothetical protein